MNLADITPGTVLTTKKTGKQRMVLSVRHYNADQPGAGTKFSRIDRTCIHTSGYRNGKGFGAGISYPLDALTVEITE